MYHERQQRQHCLKHAINNLLQREAFSISDLNKLADSIHAQRTLFFGNYDANVLAVALDTLGLELKWHDPRDTQLAALHLEQPCAQQQRQQARQGVTQVQEQACLQEQQQQQEKQQEQPPPKQEHRRQLQQPEQVPSQHEAANQQPDQQQQVQQVHKQQEQLQAQQQTPQQLTQLGSGQAGSRNAPDHCTSAADGSSCQQQQQQQLVGIVLNVRGDGIWAKLTGGRHWLAIKCIHGNWWSLDSRLQAPSSFLMTEADVANGGAIRLHRYLQQQLVGGAHIMLVYTQQLDAKA